MPTAPLQFIRGRRVKDDVLSRERKPEWLKVRAPGSPNYLRLKELMALRFARRSTVIVDENEDDAPKLQVLSLN